MNLPRIVACVAGVTLALAACAASTGSGLAPSASPGLKSASPTPGLPIGAGDGTAAISFESIPASGVLDVTLGGPDGSDSLELAPRMGVSGLDEEIVLVKNGPTVTLYPRNAGVTEGTIYRGSTPTGFLRVTVKASAGSTGTPDGASPVLKDGTTYDLNQAKKRVNDITKMVMSIMLNMYNTSVTDGKPLLATDPQFVSAVNSWDGAAQKTVDATNSGDRSAIEAYVESQRKLVEIYPNIIAS
jgi:hypothetical protein